MYADEQTHVLPSDPMRQGRIVSGLGYPDWATLLAALQARRERVSACFSALVLAGSNQGHTERSAIESLFASGADEATLVASLG
jgi:glutamate-ammonia-ligase adenylyltransferase